LETGGFCEYEFYIHWSYFIRMHIHIIW
jgi:hypothetical protein